ncbi:MAG: hypothetical protein E6R06_26365 [Mycobacterium sp.]|nr:MAG: hypothetical protein E6R06_26365 [Mycobacterium sp.]
MTPSPTPPCAVMFDFDGTLCDMSPFVDELTAEGPHRWSRFFAHTPEAAPVEAGMDVLNRVIALGWQYSVSSTRDPRSRGLVLRWLYEHRLLSKRRRPQMVLARTRGANGFGPALDCKVWHGRRRYDSRSRSLETSLFIDDEQDMVDGLIEAGVPAMHLEELVDLSDAELRDLLRYSRRAWRKRWDEEQALAAATEPPPGGPLSSVLVAGGAI